MPQQTQGPEVVVITGASGGVGRATAQAFAKRGAQICLVARGEAGLQGAKRDVERLGGKAIVVAGDAADPQTHERAAQQAEATFGSIDIWVNDAFTTVFSPFMEVTPEEYRRVTEVTYLGHVFGTQAALRRMLPRDRGVIVQVGSALAYRGIPLQTALGLEPDALNQTLRIHRPHLPDWLASVTIHGLCVAKATVDVRYRREEGTTLVAVLERTGSLEVVVQY